MVEKLKCLECGKTFMCDPDGDCWCKSYPVTKIPEELKGDQCFCSCVLDRLRKDQQADVSEVDLSD